MESADRRRRWQLVLPHRPYLVRIAMSRGMSRDDAEDCAQEAMVRCVGFEALDETRVVEFLATTTMRLCVDRHRAHAHDAKVGLKLVPWFVDEPSPEDATCDRGEATWVAAKVASLPESQRVALAAKADGLSCQEIATRMGLSYKAVESLLSRARAYVRAAVATAWVLAARVRRRGDEIPVDAPAFAMAALVTITALAPAGPASPVRSVPPRVVAVQAAAPRDVRAPAPVAAPRPVATPYVRVTPAAEPEATDPVLPPRPPLPLPTDVPTDPCDAQLPHVSTCVPLEGYRPGAGLQRCIQNGPEVSTGPVPGFSC